MWLSDIFLGRNVFIASKSGAEQVWQFVSAAELVWSSLLQCSLSQSDWQAGLVLSSQESQGHSVTKVLFVYFLL